MISPARRRQAVEHVQQALEVSERRAGRVIGKPRSTQRYSSVRAEDEIILTEYIVALASQYGRYGYRRITGMLRNQGGESEPQARRANLAERKLESAF